MLRAVLLGLLLTAFDMGEAAANANAAVTSLQPALSAGSSHAITGVIGAISGYSLMLHLRNGRPVRVDATQAMRELRTTELFVSRPVRIYGHYAAGTFEAWSIQRARDDPATWPSDY